MERLKGQFRQRVDQTFLRRELPSEFDNPIYRAMIPLTEIAATLRRTQVEALGQVPTKGPALIVSNHPDSLSSIVLPWAMMHLANRPTYMVLRDTLLDPSIQEEANVLERTGKSGDALNTPSKFRDAMAWFMSHGGSVTVHRGKPSREFIKTDTKRVLEADELLGIFFQETRTAEYDLSNTMPGPALIAKENPDVPIYLMAMTNIGIEKANPKTWFKPTVTLDEPFSYNELRGGVHLPTRELQTYMTKRMATLLRRKLPFVNT